MNGKEGEVAKLRGELERTKKRLDRLEEGMEEMMKLNLLNDFLLGYGRKAYFLFGPFDHETALSKLERDSNWPWREVNRRCNFCGCYLFPAKESDRLPPMDNNNIDYEQASRERALSYADDRSFDAQVRDRMLREPGEYEHYYYARGRKVPFGDYTVLYFHGPCFEAILEGDYEDGGRELFLGSD